MAARVKERNQPNHFKMKHDNHGSYTEHNGLRTYAMKTALSNVTSTISGSHQAPEGSLARTTHATGKGSLWIAGPTTWKQVTAV